MEAQLGHHPTEISSVATTTEGMSLTRPGSWELGKLTQRGSAGSEAKSGLERGQEEGMQVSLSISALEPGPRDCEGEQRLQERSPRAPGQGPGQMKPHSVTAQVGGEPTPPLSNLALLERLRSLPLPSPTPEAAGSKAQMWWDRRGVYPEQTLFPSPNSVLREKVDGPDF